MKIYIINGPNLNILGKRQPDIYGNRSFDDYLSDLRNKYPEIEILYFQSNHAGEIVDKIQEISGKCDALIINPAAYTHSSLAIADAIASLSIPVAEVHISNIFSRENIRHQSLISKYVKGIISGFGLDGYELALKALINLLNFKEK